MSDTADRLLPADSPETLEVYLRGRGGAGLDRALGMEPAEVVSEVDAAGLRGRGGAGFPTGRKWRGVQQSAAASQSVLTLVVNAAEGEPGTFKDRPLIEQQPYALLEGLCIALHATGATSATIGIKHSFVRPRERLAQALDEIRAAGWVGADRIDVVTGPDLYLFGEESALLEVIEGKLPMPRVVKPYDVGLHATTASPNPTIVNNVETVMHVAWILANGSEAFRHLGTIGSPGTMLFTVVGDVASPGVYELPLGTRLRTLLVDIAGASDMKAVYSGVSNPVITPDHLDVPLCFDAMHDAGVGLGSGGFIVYDRSRHIVDVLAVLLNFLAVESCGQCNACKLGNTAMSELLAGVQRGEGTQTDLEALLRRSHTVTDQNRCYLPVGSQLVVGSTVAAFVDEFVETVRSARPTPGGLPTPIVRDIDPTTGTVRYDDRYALKRADWSYEDEDPVSQRLQAIRQVEASPTHGEGRRAGR